MREDRRSFFTRKDCFDTDVKKSGGKVPNRDDKTIKGAGTYKYLAATWQLWKGFWWEKKEDLPKLHVLLLVENSCQQKGAHSAFSLMPRKLFKMW